MPAGYGLVGESWRHNTASNKAYALSELIKYGPSVATIDYPTCNSSVLPSTLNSSMSEKVSAAGSVGT